MSKKRKPTTKVVDGVRLRTDRLWKMDAMEAVPFDFAGHVWQLTQTLYQAGIARGLALAAASEKAKKATKETERG